MNELIEVLFFRTILLMLLNMKTIFYFQLWIPDAIFHTEAFLRAATRVLNCRIRRVCALYPSIYKSLVIISLFCMQLLPYGAIRAPIAIVNTSVSTIPQRIALSLLLSEIQIVAGVFLLQR